MSSTRSSFRTGRMNIGSSRFISRLRHAASGIALGIFGSAALCQSVVPMPPAYARLPPKTWVDADTGHRVTRLTDEPNSQSLDFDTYAYTPDGRDMIYVASGGLYDLSLTTLKSRLVTPGKVTDIIVAPRTRRVFFQSYEDGPFYVVDIDTKVLTKISGLPARARVSSINADETLLTGTLLEGVSLDFLHYRLKAQAAVTQSVLAESQAIHAARRAALENPPPLPDPNYNGAAALAAVKADADAREEEVAHAFLKADSDAAEERFAAKSTQDIFTFNLQTGKSTIILQGTDWLNHVQFSPTDPNLILYAHEGPSLMVDRVWTIRADGSQNQLLEGRTDPLGIATHQFWSHDGKTVWFDLQESKGEKFAVAGIDVATGGRTVYTLTKAEASSHYNVSADGSVFCGDGNLMTAGEIGVDGHRPMDRKWIELLRPQPDGTFHSTRLAHITANDYARSEPDVRFTPDKKMVIFTSNMFGLTYVFGVEVEKSAGGVSTGN